VCNSVQYMQKTVLYNYLLTGFFFSKLTMPKFWENWIFLFSMLSTDSKFENIVYSKMDITYRFRKINSNVFQNVLMKVFTLNGSRCIAKESRWIDSPFPSAHTHTYYTYNSPTCISCFINLHTSWNTYAYCQAARTSWPLRRRQSYT